MKQSSSHHSRRRPTTRQFTDQEDETVNSLKPPKRRGSRSSKSSGSSRRHEDTQQSSEDPDFVGKIPELQPPSGVARGGPQKRYYENDEDLARRHQEYYDEEDRKIRASKAAQAQSSRDLAVAIEQEEYNAQEQHQSHREAQDSREVHQGEHHTGSELQDRNNSRVAREIPVAEIAPANSRVARASTRHHDYYNKQEEEGGYHPKEEVVRQVPIAASSSAHSKVARSGTGYADDYEQEEEEDHSFPKEVHYVQDDRKMRATKSRSSRRVEFPRDSEVPATHRTGSARGSREEHYYNLQNQKARSKQKKKKHKGDLVSLGLFSTHEEEKIQDSAEMLELRPGAIRIGHHQDNISYVTGDTEGAQSPPLRRGEEGHLIHAFLVNEEEERRAREEEVQQRLRRSQQQQHQREPDLPLRVDAEAVEYKPWYKRPPILIALGILLLAAIGIALGVGLTRDNGGTTVVEDFPTVSPAPTALTDITVVVQLDEKPAETGWSLECDGLLVQAVPQGSYAFLPIGVLIPSYRLEITVLVVEGSQCVYTLTDAGKDGLLGGFYEVFYGDDTGNVANRIQRGAPQSETQTILFEVVPPNAATFSPSEPTAPTPVATPSPVIQGCTVCPDGSAVPEPSAWLQGLFMTCGELDEVAKTVLNSTRCLEIQQSATACGCLNFCTTMCPDGSLVDASVEDKLVKVQNGRPLTCGDIQDQVIVRNSSKSDCLSAHFLGEEICDCPPTGNFCRICQGGAVPANLTKEIIPGVACGDISGIAYSLLRSNPAFSVICPACLSIGEYCGCPPVETPRVFCRLCGDRLLPDTDRLVYSPLLEINTTCFHIEFHSNLGVMPNGTTSVIPNCSLVQEQSSADCCVE